MDLVRQARRKRVLRTWIEENSVKMRAALKMFRGAEEWNGRRKRGELGWWGKLRRRAASPSRRRTREKAMASNLRWVNEAYKPYARIIRRAPRRVALSQSYRSESIL